MSQSRLSIIPSRAVSDSRLTDTQFRTLCAIGSFTGKDQSAFPKVKSIAEVIGKTRETTSRAISKLKSYGYVKTIERTREDGGQASNLYYVLLDEDLPENTISSGTPCDADVTPPVTLYDHTPCDDTASHHKNDPLNDTSSDEEVVTPEPINDVTQAYEAYQAVAERLKAENGRAVWPVLRKLNPKRRSALKARLKEFGLEDWGEVLRKAASSDFLCGRKTDWAADFEFLTSPSGFLNTLEGKYDNRASSPRPASKRQFAHSDPFSAAVDEAVDILADQAPPRREGPQHHGARPFPESPYDGGDTITLDAGDYAYADKLAS